MQVYVSWIKGLFQDENAIKLIESSPIITGIELSGGNDEMPTKKLNLKLNIHTPNRTGECNLINEGFISSMQDNLRIFDESPLATFHMISRSTTQSQEENIANCKKNLLFCCEKFGKDKVAFETTCYYPTISPLHLTDPEIIKEFLSTGSGLIFDTSHTFITAIRREKDTGEPAREYLRRLINASAGRVYEMHFNVPAEIDGSFTDVHGMYKENDATSDAIIELAKKVIALNPQIKVINLEMNTKAPPDEHAKIMVKQAEMIVKRLGIEDKIEKRKRK